MRAFVTGGTGFIGSQLIDYLNAAGWEVTALIRKDSKSKLKNIEGLQILEGDLTGEIPGLEKALDRCDVIFHSAAIRDRWGTKLEAYSRVNIYGTRRLLEASQGRAGRFVYISSVGVMGEHDRLDVDETFSTESFKGKIGYHSTKAAAEELVMQQANDIEVSVVRPTITYGPGDTNGMLTRLIAMISNGKFIRIGRGLNKIHLTYIGDLIQGIHLTGTHPEANGQIFIIAGPEPITMKALIDLIELKLSREPKRFFIPESVARTAAVGVESVFSLGALLRLSRFREPVITRDKIDTICNNQGYSNAKAERMLGYSPSTGCVEGLEKTISWMASAGLLDLTGGLTPGLRSQTKTPG